MEKGCWSELCFEMGVPAPLRRPLHWPPKHAAILAYFQNGTDLPYSISAVQELADLLEKTLMLNMIVEPKA